MYVATYGTPSQIISNALLDHFFSPRVCYFVGRRTRVEVISFPDLRQSEIWVRNHVRENEQIKENYRKVNESFVQIDESVDRDESEDGQELPSEAHN